MRKKNNRLIIPALYGGKKIINYRFKPYNTLGKKELSAATNVIKTGKLSQFKAAKSRNFYGGFYVRKFEDNLKKFYNVKYAITFNSWTSGLIASLGALDLEPGDEVITTPWTMSACTTAILHWNAIPVFADISPNNFCIDPEKIKKKISKKTKAILIVDIFGVPCDIKKVQKIIKNKNIKILTDSAQTPYFPIYGKLAGTLSDVGGYSLNCHKHINTGEGGIAVTNSKKIADRIYKIRNHAEGVVNLADNLSNMLGYNFRMGELESAIGIQQLKKLKKIVIKRNKLFSFLAKKLNVLKGINVPTSNYKFNNYYIFPIVIDKKILKKNRNGIIKLLKAEGVEGLVGGYANLHLLPMFRKKIAYGNKGFPWKSFNKKIIYNKGDCPVAEKLHDEAFISFQVCLFSLDKKDILKIAKAFYKVWNFLKIQNLNI